MCVLNLSLLLFFFFFFQAEDGIRDYKVTGVQTCALPIWVGELGAIGLASCPPLNDCSIHPVLPRTEGSWTGGANSQRQTSTSELQFRARKAPVCNTGRQICACLGQQCENRALAKHCI